MLLVRYNGERYCQFHARFGLGMECWIFWGTVGLSLRKGATGQRMVESFGCFFSKPNRKWQVMDNILKKQAKFSSFERSAIGI